MEVILEQPQKADSPILSTDSGISIEVSLEHNAKAKSPILVTEFGISMAVRLEQPKKSRLPDAGYCVYRSVVVNRIGYTNLASCGAVIYFASFV